MARYRTINVNLDRGYRNDLNANFEQICIDITNLESNLNVIVGGGFIESLEMARDGANAAATYANTEAQYANAQGTYAKNQGDYAKAQGDHAKQKGDYADEKAIAADEAAGRANSEATGLEALKVAVVDATQSANVQADRADQAATNAESAARYANEQGDYAKRMADDIAEQAGVTSVNGQSGAVTLTAEDVGAIPASDKGVAGGVAGLNAAGKVVDASGNEVEGKVTSVNGQVGEVEITPANIGAETPDSVQVKVDEAVTPITTQLTNHESRLNELENSTGEVATNVSGLYRETAWLKLKQEASDRIEGGITFADDFLGSRFGFTFNKEESQNIIIRDGKMLMLEDVEVSHSAVDEVVVNQAYSTAGNGGRKFIRLSNGTLVAGAMNSSGNEFRLYNSIDNGVTWTFRKSVVATVGDFALCSNGDKITLIYANNNKFINVETFNSDFSHAVSQKTIDTQTAIGNVSLAIDPTNGHLHAAWASKNATYSYFNVRYSKSTDGGATWSTATQITTINILNHNISSVSLDIYTDGRPYILTTFANTTANASYFVNINKFNGSTWDTQNNGRGSLVFSMATYPNSSVMSLLGSDGTIHAVWHGTDSIHTTTDYIRHVKSSDGGFTWAAMQKLVVGANASISENSLGHIFIAYQDAGVTKFIKSIDGGDNWSVPTIVGTGTNPSSLDDTSTNFAKPLTVRMGTSNVLFSGEWTETYEEARTTASAVYDIPSTDYVGAFVKKQGAITATAYLNDVPMDSTLIDGEYKFETLDLLPAPVPAKLRIELSRETVDGGENDAVTRILGGRS